MNYNEDMYSAAIRRLLLNDCLDMVELLLPHISGKSKKTWQMFFDYCLNRAAYDLIINHLKSRQNKINRQHERTYKIRFGEACDLPIVDTDDWWNAVSYVLDGSYKDAMRSVKHIGSTLIPNTDILIILKRMAYSEFRRSSDRVVALEITKILSEFEPEYNSNPTPETIEFFEQLKALDHKLRFDETEF